MSIVKENVAVFYDIFDDTLRESELEPAHVALLLKRLRRYPQPATFYAYLDKVLPREFATNAKRQARLDELNTLMKMHALYHNTEVVNSIEAPDIDGTTFVRNHFKPAVQFSFRHLNLTDELIAELRVEISRRTHALTSQLLSQFSPEKRRELFTKYRQQEQQYPRNITWQFEFDIPLDVRTQIPTRVILENLEHTLRLEGREKTKCLDQCLFLHVVITCENVPNREQRLLDILDHGGSLNHPDEYGRTPLKLLVDSGDLVLFRRAIAHNAAFDADLSLRDHSNNGLEEYLVAQLEHLSPSEKARWRRAHRQLRSKVKLVSLVGDALSHAEPKSVIEAQDVAHLAAFHDHRAYMELCLEVVCPSSLDRRKNTVFMVAAIGGAVEVFNYLLTHYLELIDPTHRNQQGHSLHCLVALSGHEGIQAAFAAVKDIITPPVPPRPTGRELELLKKMRLRTMRNRRPEPPPRPNPNSVRRALTQHGALGRPSLRQ